MNKQNKPQLLESVEYETENAKGAITLVFFVLVLALIGLIICVSTTVSVVTF